jgi:hypothetical protein
MGRLPAWQTAKGRCGIVQLTVVILILLAYAAIEFMAISQGEYDDKEDS